MDATTGDVTGVMANGSGTALPASGFHLTPALSPSGEGGEAAAREGMCGQCGGAFSYTFAGRKRSRCGGCKRAVYLKNKKDIYARLKLKTDEPTAWEEGPLKALIVRTASEAGVILGIVQQRVHDAERSGLVRLRRLLLEPVCIYREPVTPLDFSFREMETELRDWRLALEMLLREAEETGDAELTLSAHEMALEILNFDNALQKAVNDGRGKKALKTISVNGNISPATSPRPSPPAEREWNKEGDAR